MSSVELDTSIYGVWAPLEPAPVAAYLLRRVPDDFILEALNEQALSRAPALINFLGKPCMVLYRDQPTIIEAAFECMRDKTTVRREVSVRRHDRMEADQRQHMVYVHVAPDRMLIFAADVSQVDNLSAALAESNERYHRLLASIPDAVLVRGMDERVLTCNDVAVKLFGHQEVADILGKVDVLAQGIEVAAEGDKQVMPEMLPSRRAIRTGRAVRGELYSVRARNSEPRFVRVSSEPLRTRAGAVGGSVTLFTDETERVTARRLEHEAASKLEMALDAAAMGIWDWAVADDKGTCSESLGHIFKVDTPNRNFVEVLKHVHPDDAQGVLTWANSARQSAAGLTFEHEFRIVGLDGQTRWARARGRNEGGAVQSRLTGTLADVTARRHLEDSLRQSHHLESIGRLAGGIAHDFNNLLTAMQGSLEMLADVCPPSALEDLNTVRYGAERARELTAQLLAFARKQPIILDSVDVGVLVARVEQLLHPLLGPAIQLVVATEPGLTVRADAKQLEQVLVNLSANARDAMPNGGRLDLRLRAEQDEGGSDVVVLEVEDCGLGIPAHALPHVFDPFYNKGEGASLGLASSYGIVKQHGGEIRVGSRLGSGTVFRILLPRLAAQTARAPSVAPPAQRKGCILVVDDDDSVRKTTCRLLKSLGYEVLAAGDGIEALNLARSHEGPIDILLCDVAMPGQSGPEVAQNVLGVRSTIRVLFVSGYPEGKESVISAHGFLQKPYTRASLGDKLQSLWKGSHTTH